VLARLGHKDSPAFSDSTSRGNPELNEIVHFDFDMLNSWATVFSNDSGALSDVLLRALRMYDIMQSFLHLLN
jgi:hypothetical protein